MQRDNVIFVTSGFSHDAHMFHIISQNTNKAHVPLTQEKARQRLLNFFQQGFWLMATDTYHSTWANPEAFIT